MFKKVREDWQRDKVLFFMEYIGYTVILGGNIWIVTRPISPYEVLFYVIIANLTGFFIGASVIRPVLLGTIFKKRFNQMIDKIIEMAKK